MLSQLKWQPLVERRRHARLVMFIIYKIHYQLVSPYTLTSKFYLQPTLRIFCLSSSCDYHLQSFFPRTVRDWNTLPQEVVQMGITCRSFPTCLSYRLKTAGVHLLCRARAIVFNMFLSAPVVWLHRWLPGPCWMEEWPSSALRMRTTNHVGY